MPQNEIILSWKEPQEFQELLRLRRLRRRSLWQNAKPFIINTALLFSLALIFFALKFRDDLKQLLTWQPLLGSVVFATAISLVWRSFERKRKIEDALFSNDGELFLSRLGDFHKLALKEIKVYVFETLQEDDYKVKVLVLKTNSGQQYLVALPDEQIAKTLEAHLKKLKIKKGILDQHVEKAS